MHGTADSRVTLGIGLGSCYGLTQPSSPRNNTQLREASKMGYRIGDRCPRCDSPKPHLHPAVQAGGEVQPCPHEFHDAITASQPNGRPFVLTYG
jgi:hypothetical protein